MESFLIKLVALLLALHEMLYSGVRRAFGIIIVIIAISLLLFANSKTALGFALFVPCLAGLALIIGKKTRISLAIVLLFIPICYIVLSNVSGFNMNRISYMLYGDSTFTGRTLIWDFAQFEIERRPFLGWGYQGFWLVGADAPSHETQRIREHIEFTFPHVEVEFHDGGQPLYPYLVGVE